MSLTKQDKQDIHEIVDKTVNKAVGELAEVVSEFAIKVDRRFDQVDTRFDQVDKRFDKLESEVATVKKDVQNILGMLDSLESDVQLNSDKRAVMGMQLNRIHDWIERTAAKVGVEFIH